MIVALADTLKIIVSIAHTSYISCLAATAFVVDRYHSSDVSSNMIISVLLCIDISG